MATDLSADEAAERLASNAARAAKLAMLCLVIAVLVLAIDHQMKKAIVEEGRKALALLDEARKLAEEARQGGPVWAAKPDGAVSGVVVDGADGVVHAAGASAAAGADARRGSRKAPGVKTGEG